MASTIVTDFSDHFSIANIPFGIASSANHPTPAAVTRIHDKVVFLDILALEGAFEGLKDIPSSVFQQPTLNAFAALGRSAYHAVRETLQDLIKSNRLTETSTVAASEVKMHLPVHSGDFLDFSCVKEHITTGTEIMMGKRAAPPAFDYMPLAYGGRSSSLVVSGTAIHRPLGLSRAASDASDQRVVFGPSRELDYELEVACVIGKPIPVGKRLLARDADEHIFGIILLNDWSARDFQALEMVPMGPQSSKNFGTTISPWIITTLALEQSSAPAPVPLYEPQAPHLIENPTAKLYSVQLQSEYLVGSTGNDAGQVICRSRLEWTNWSFRQMVAQSAVAGSGLVAGDILACGTVSGKNTDEKGCLYEMTWGWKNPLKLKDGTERTSLLDGDGIRITAWSGKPGDSAAGTGVGFGECTGSILPPIPL